jgi:hypothetical protein
VLGNAEMLRVVGARIQHEFAAWNASPASGWEGSEAALYALRCIGRKERRMCAAS